MPDDVITKMVSDPDFGKLPIDEQRKALAAHDPDFGKLGDADIMRFTQAHRVSTVPTEKQAAANPPIAPIPNLQSILQQQQTEAANKVPTAMIGASPSPLPQQPTQQMSRGAQEQAEMQGTNILKQAGPPVGAAIATALVPPSAPLMARIGLAGAGGATAASPFGAKQAAVEGGKQAAYETGGAALSYLGSKIAPAAIRTFTKAIGQGKLDEAGQAIDQYLASGPLSKIRLNLKPQVDSILNQQIDQARRIGSESLAKRLENLQKTWASNYKLDNMTLSEANQFKRELGKFTSFAGDANKVTLNQVQRMVGGTAKQAIEDAAPGVKELNQVYENRVLMQKAVRQSGKKLTTGFTGAGVGATSEAFKALGKIAPNLLRAVLGMTPSGMGEQ